MKKIASRHAPETDERYQARTNKLKNNPLYFGNLSAKLPFGMSTSGHGQIVNAHGKFYGLRSKYDGNGKKRAPLKAKVA